MSHDDDAFSGGDGVLTLTELKDHIDRLDQQRFELIDIGAPTSFVDSRIATARKLHKDMFDSNAAGVKYLPSELLQLAPALRKRASELLIYDDIGSLGIIDQFVIDHARDRYDEMQAIGSLATASSASKALQEITQLAIALGLE